MSPTWDRPRPGSIADQRRIEREAAGRAVMDENLAYCRAVLRGDKSATPPGQGDLFAAAGDDRPEEPEE